MKKIISNLFFIALAILPLTGCGNEEKSIYALNWNDMLFSDGFRVGMSEEELIDFYGDEMGENM